MASQPKIVARFIPQAWQNDYTIRVDAEGPTEWDATADVLGLSLQEVQGIRDNDYSADHLHDCDSAPSWVRDWSGPFEVEVEESVREFFEAYGFDVEDMTQEDFEAVRAKHALSQHSVSTRRKGVRVSVWITAEVSEDTDVGSLTVEFPGGIELRQSKALVKASNIAHETFEALVDFIEGEE